MISTLGFTIQDWQFIHQQNPNKIALLLNKHLKAIDSQDNAWIYLATTKQIRDQIKPLLVQYLTNPNSLPLFGVPFAVKDNIDVAHWPTTAACPSLKYIAKEDSYVVARLKQAGGVVIGKTNLDQYATGLVGTRSPFGIVRNTFNSKYICGGSSSGSASVLARGLVGFSLGTDTAGSGRIPAAFNNIVGLKPTKGWLSCRGVIPACRLHDTVSIFALTVEDAFNVANIAGGYDPEDPYSRINNYVTPSRIKNQANFAIPQQLKFFKDQHAEAAWNIALKEFQSIGIAIHEIDFTAFYQLAEELYKSAWVAERTISVGEIIQDPEKMDPIVYNIISKGLQYSAIDAYQAEYVRAKLTRCIQNIIRQFDALIVPTSPTIYTLVDIEKKPKFYNSILGTYTNFANLADLCALALPGPFRADGLPSGVTIIAPAWNDRALANVGLQWQKQIQLPLGATGKSLKIKNIFLTPSIEHIRIAIGGTYLTSMSINLNLYEARIVKETNTAPYYRLFIILDKNVKKVGLVYDKFGKSILVELWEIPLGKFGEFIFNIPISFSIEPLKLADGDVIKGLFICDAEVLKKSLEITEFGSWRNWLTTFKD